MPADVFIIVGENAVSVLWGGRGVYTTLHPDGTTSEVWQRPDGQEVYGSDVPPGQRGMFRTEIQRQLGLPATPPPPPYTGPVPPPYTPPVNPRAYAYPEGRRVRTVHLPPLPDETDTPETDAT